LNEGEARYILHRRVQEWEERGWIKTNALDNTHHGYYSVLMIKPPEEVTALRLLDTAARLVSGDRNDTHGDMLQNHACIAALWNGYLKARKIAGKPDELGPDDAALMLGLMKGARTLTGAFNEDDNTDGAAYFAIAAECRARQG
jgi:hypothetical protein